MLSNQQKFIAAALVAVCQAQARFLNDDEPEVLTTSYSGDLCCTLYQHAYYNGREVQVCLPSADFEGEKVFQMADYDFHDSMSSWWCGKSVSYNFCRNEYGSCTGNDGMSGAGNARSSVTGHNDFLDRVVLRRYDATEQGAIVTFYDSECRSDAGRFDATIDPTGRAEYNMNEMYERNVKNDTISSIMVPQGYSVELFQHDGYIGNSKIVNGGNWTGADQKMECQTLYDWNDTTSSLAVYRTEMGMYSIGDWVSITATESVDFTYHVGFTTSESQEKFESSKTSLAMQMSVGMEFWGFSAGMSIESSYEHTISTATKSSMEQDISIDYQIKCTGEVGTDGGVGLWQFVVYNGEGIDNGIAYTGNTVCRYGDLYNVKPACPWNACIGGDCASCNTDWIE